MNHSARLFFSFSKKVHVCVHLWINMNSL